MVTRRNFVKGLITAAFAAGFIGGYSSTINRIIKPKFTPVLPDPLNGRDVRFVYSVCLGCNVRCGIRAKVVKEGDIEVVERIEGNPYHVYNRDTYLEQYDKLQVLDYNTPAVQSLKHNGSLCPRGVAGIYYLYDPYRVIKPLKRAGPRGSGKWKEISWEELIKEVVNGGFIEETGEKLPGLKDFFPYGKLKQAGINDPNSFLNEMKNDVNNILSIAQDQSKTYNDLVNAIESFKTKWNERLKPYGLTLNDILINPDLPDLGTKANQVAFYRGRGQDNADTFTQRFIHSLGSVNWLRHTSSCQLGYYMGNKLWADYADIQADPLGAKVIIMAGVCMGRLHPGATGQGAMIARAAKGELKLYYVNPVSPRTNARGFIKWVPIKPGTDAALALAIIQWLIDNNAFAMDFLSSPNLNAAKKKGYPVNTNATWLVITTKDHPRMGEFLKARDIGLENSDKPVVYSNGKFVTYDSVDSGELFYTGVVTLVNGDSVEVKTALQILKEEAFSKSIQDWSNECGVPVNTIIEMARSIAEAAPRAGTIIHRGVGMHPNGDYNVYTFRMIDILIGNFHKKGGLLGRPLTTNYNGFLYNTSASGFGEPPRWGPPIDRHGYSYEKTLTYWLKVKKGENPYPAQRPWYPLTPEESYTEFFAGIDLGYPYSLGVLIMYYANPILAANYGVKFISVLSDTKKLPLFIAITTSINETFLYADYIVPDTTYLETGTLGVQYLYATGASVYHAEGWRCPVVLPLTQMIGTCPNGHPRYASMWEFLIDVAKTLNAPGYGDKAIPGVKGKKYENQWFSMHCIWEYIMRVYANAAMDAQSKGLIPKDIPQEEISFVETNYPIAKFKDIIPQDEWIVACYGLARGGVFTKYEDSFDKNGISKRPLPTKLLQIWNESLAKTRNSITGVKFWGGPKYFPPATYAPLAQKTSIMNGMAGTPIRSLYTESEYPLNLVFESGPLYTKHRSQFYYWIKQMVPENYVLINPSDAATFNINTGDVVEILTPVGSIKAPAVVSDTVTRGVIMVPYGMGRWADTVVKKPKYIQKINEPSIQNLINNLPDKAELPPDSINPVKQLPDLVKRLLFTKSPQEYYNIGDVPDTWRFSGITPNIIEMYDDSLNKWPLLSWVGASQAYYTVPATIKKTGEQHSFKYPNIIY